METWVHNSNRFPRNFTWRMKESTLTVVNWLPHEANSQAPELLFSSAVCNSVGGIRQKHYYYGRTSSIATPGSIMLRCPLLFKFTPPQFHKTCHSNTPPISYNAGQQTSRIIYKFNVIWVTRRKNGTVCHVIYWEIRQQLNLSPNWFWSLDTTWKHMWTEV